MCKEDYFRLVIFNSVDPLLDYFSINFEESANFGFKPPYQRGAHDFMKKCKATQKP